jgi:hypothetical protein
MKKYIAILLALVGTVNAGQIQIDTTERIVLSTEEYIQLQKGDPILEFIAQVNEDATKDPLWATDPKGSLYRAYTARTHKRIIERYKAQRK